MRKPRYAMGFHAHSHGFAWAVFESALAPYDWGFVSARAQQRRDKNVICLRRLERLLSRFEPEVLVVEAFAQGTRRHPRIDRLYRAAIDLAASMRVEVAVYTRTQVRLTFSHVGATTRQEIAEAVGRHLEPFQQHVPRKRRPWDPEDERMALFSAAATLLTHFRLGSDLDHPQL